MGQKRDLNVSRRTRDEDLPGLIYHQRAQSNDFWLRAATLIGRVFCPYGMSCSVGTENMNS
jgi:hypothetical protein